MIFFNIQLQYWLCTLALTLDNIEYQNSLLCMIENWYIGLDFPDFPVQYIFLLLPSNCKA